MADSTVAPSGGDFTTLDAALSDAGTGAGDTITIEGDWTSTTDTTSATVADDNITVITSATGGARHAGFDNAGTNYELAVTDGATAAIEVDNTGCTIDGLLVLQNATGTSDECIRMSDTGGTLTVVNTIMRAASAVSDQDGLYHGSINCTINTENCIAIGFGRAGFHGQISSGPRTATMNFISCDAWDCDAVSSETEGGGFAAREGANASAVENMNLHNCFSFKNATGSSDDYDEFSGSGTINWQIDNCIDSDGSITNRDSGAVNANENYVIGESDTSDADGDVLVNDITTAPFDLRLQDDANNDAQDEHTNATGAGLTIGDFTTGDIAGTSRPQNTSHDIGAFEVVVAGNAETLAAVATGVAILTTTLAARRALAGTATGVAGVARVARFFRDLSATASGIATLVAAAAGEFFETIAAVATGVATLNRRLLAARTLAASGTGVAGMSRRLQLFRALAALATGVASVTAATVGGIAAAAMRTYRNMRGGA